MGKRKKAASKKMVSKKKAGPVVQMGRPAPPGPGTTIIVRPGGGGGNQITFEIGGAPALPVSAGTNLLNYRAFTTVLWMKADVNINGTIYQNVSCRRLRADLTIGGATKQLQFEVLDSVPSWWLAGVEYVPDDGFAADAWNGDLVNTVMTGTLVASVHVQTFPANPDWIDRTVERIEIAFV